MDHCECAWNREDRILHIHRHKNVQEAAFYLVRISKTDSFTDGVMKM